MSVTTIACGNETVTDSRNGDLWAAWWSAESCGLCGEELTGVITRLERWYIGRTLSGPPGPVPICSTCFERKRGYLADPWTYRGSPEPCEACGRSVVSNHRLERQYVYCSERCARRIYNLHRSEKRARARPSTCTACSEQMSPSRSDARYCSNACRQRAYRKRTIR